MKTNFYIAIIFKSVFFTLVNIETFAYLQKLII